MKIRRFIPKQKLQATARRLPQPGTDQFEHEPDMSFARALIVVVVLHVVAVGGIYAFNSIKAHKVAQTDVPARSSAPAEQKAQTAAAKVSGAKDAESHQVVPPAKAPVKISPKPAADGAKPDEKSHKRVADEPAKPPVKPATVSSREAGELYTVVKGDNLLTIAKKLHVSSEELLKVNKIENPKKLQIGQKLRIPVKPRKE